MKTIRIIFCKILSAVTLVSFMAVSCSPVKNIAYFQDRTVNHPEKIDMHAGIVIQPKDMISIVVSSRNPELASMFNLGSSGEQEGTLGYMVDDEGFIDFPALGKLQVSGLTRWQLSDMVEEELMSRGLLNDAVATVSFLNFKISVLGEVNSPGTYTVSDDGITLLQALSLAGDLTIYGKRGNVSVMREIDGRRVFYDVDLCSVDLFKSPAYHMRQNDIIYVEPGENRARLSTMDDKGLRTASIAISSGSVLISVATFLISILSLK